MRNKEKLHEWIDRYNNNELSGDELGIFLEMMNKDHRVREEVWLDNELNSVLKEDDILALRKKIQKIRFEDPTRRTRNTRILLMAASLLILFSMEYLLFYLARSIHKTDNSELIHLQNYPGEKKIDQPKTTFQDLTQVYGIFQNDIPGLLNNDSHRNKNTFDMLACYQPNKALENLIGMTNRSGGFKMLKPSFASEFPVTSTIWFFWKTEDPEETSLIVENNNGIVVYESDSNNNQSIFLKASSLDFGLFYYKIMRKDEVVYFGKFTVQ